MNRLLLVAGAVLAVSSSAAEAQCMKWVAKGVAPCQVLNVSCGLGPPDLYWFQQKAFYDIIHQDDALAACKAGATNTVWETGHVFDIYPHPMDPTYVYCLVKDVNSPIPGPPTYPTDHVGGWVVQYESITREACCERIPTNGPYQTGLPGTSGGEFSSSQRTAAKNTNATMNGGSIKSDYLWGDGTRWFPSEPVYLSYDQFWYFNVGDDGNVIQPRGIIKKWNPTFVNLDHIVPRKDKYGCDCGTNSLDNGILISAGLNVEMSNNCEDPRRVKILNHYAP